MKYLLDTCVITDFIKNQEKTVRRIKEERPKDLCISVITIFEIGYGIEKVKGTKQGEYISKTSKLLTDEIREIVLGHDVAEEGSKIRVELDNIGTQIGSYDLLIGATARYYGLIMATSNVREFERIEGLKIENWRN